MSDRFVSLLPETSPRMVSPAYSIMQLTVEPQRFHYMLPLIRGTCGNNNKLMISSRISSDEISRSRAVSGDHAAKDAFSLSIEQSLLAVHGASHVFH